MNTHIRHKLVSGLAFLSLLSMVGACSQESAVEPVYPSDSETSQIVPITLSFETEGTGVYTRGESDGTETGAIGSGEMVDILVFAIYDSEGKLLNYQVEGYKSLEINGKTLNAGTGQNIMKWEDAKNGITLDFDIRKTYRIVAWAQSSKCDAYRTTDLKKVTVSYEGAVNNDESRDAFCKSLEFQGDIPELKVILRRPFAQINVGTTGADYRNNRLLQGGTYYTKSSVTISGVSTSINVVDDIIDSQNLTQATFSSSKIPAYINMDIPSVDDDLLEKTGEQFLQIHLTGSDATQDFLKYKTDYPTMDEAGKYLTETFKYLSMCYVLVPSTSPDGGSVLPEFTVTFQSDNRGDSSRSLTNLPVNRNWRTNILGGLYFIDNPGGDTDPDNPDNPGGDPGDNPDPDSPDEPIDDPTSLFNSVGLNLVIECDYFNNNNLDINSNPLKQGSKE